MSLTLKIIASTFRFVELSNIRKDCCSKMNEVTVTIQNEIDIKLSIWIGNYASLQSEYEQLYLTCQKHHMFTWQNEPCKIIIIISNIVPEKETLVGR